MNRKMLFIVVSFISLIIVSGCDGKQEYKVGYSGSLTGKFSDLGVQGRNGAMLAIEKINAAGGINGKKLVLEVANDRHDAETALREDLRLLKQGAVAVIGHMTSSMSMAVYSKVNKSGGVLISPTTSTTKLTGLQDGFFRTMPDVEQPAKGMAHFVADELKPASILLLKDMDNAAYVEPLANIFKEEIGKIGYSMRLPEIEYSSGTITGWDNIFRQISSYDPEYIYCFCSAKDLAGIARIASVKNLKYKFISVPWAFTKEILQMGGKSVDHIYFSSFYADDKPSPDFVEFKKNYLTRFGFEASFASAFSYEAIQALAEGLRKAEQTGAALKDVLPGIKIKGVMGDFELNEYGDVTRPTFIVKIKNQQFVTIKTIHVK